MAKHTPPIPPAGRSPKGHEPGTDDKAEKAHVTDTDKCLRNQEQQGHQANQTHLILLSPAIAPSLGQTVLR